MTAAVIRKLGGSVVSEKKMDYSKLILQDVRRMVWFITVSGVCLSFCCVFKGFTGTVPWIASMVTAAWAAFGTIIAFYYNMTKSDHSEGGITYETAKATGFTQTESVNSPAI